MMPWSRWSILTWCWMNLSDYSQLLADLRECVRKTWKLMGCSFPKGQGWSCQALFFTKTQSTGQSLRSSVLKGTGPLGKGTLPDPGCLGHMQMSVSTEDKLMVIQSFICTHFYFTLLFCFFKILLKYNCLHFPSTILSHPTNPQLPPSTLPSSVGFVHESFIHVLWWLLPYLPTIPHCPPLWLLLVCSLFQCLWLYFTSLFVLLIRFHL